MVILMLLKRFQVANERLRAGVMAGGVEPTETTQDTYAYNWVDLEHFQALLRKRVGLVGLGKIGRAAAVRLRCLGADVVYTKRTRLDEADEQALGVSWAGFDDLLEMSDCVSLHARVYPETERMMGAREFALMKRGSFFVNTARGRLVDEEALLRALESGHLAGAALDVFWYEPLPKDSPLLKAKNLLLSPHTGGIPLAESQSIELVEAAHVVSRDVT
jgi:phosphoglycerate dehydrogenase-like enzyme